MRETHLQGDDKDDSRTGVDPAWAVSVHAERA